MNISSVEVTAGLGGFLVLFVLGLVVWVLGRDLSRRLRRMRQAEASRRADIEDTERTAHDASGQPPPSSGQQPPSTGPAAPEADEQDGPTSPQG
ncbi:hypothetical protein BH23ACT6_BH23ACT6_01670 [soil metagenome]